MVEFELNADWKKEYAQKLLAMGIMEVVEEALNAAGVDWNDMTSRQYEWASWKADFSAALLYFRLTSIAPCVTDYQRDMVKEITKVVQVGGA